MGQQKPNDFPDLQTETSRFVHRAREASNSFKPKKKTFSTVWT